MSRENIGNFEDQIVLLQNIQAKISRIQLKRFTNTSFNFIVSFLLQLKIRKVAITNSKSCKKLQ